MRRNRSQGKETRGHIVLKSLFTAYNRGERVEDGEDW